MRPNASWATAAEPASTKTPTPATRWSLLWNRLDENCGPSEKNRPPIDHDEMTASAARRNGRRTSRGTLGRCGVSRTRPRELTGSGIASAPVNAIANSPSSTTYGSTRSAGSSSTAVEDTSIPSPSPPALITPFASPTAAGSRRGWRSSIAALAAPSARPVAIPCSPRATNSQTTESASMKTTLVAIRPPSATSRTGRRPTSSDRRPARIKLASTPNAYVP